MNEMIFYVLMAAVVFVAGIAAKWYKDGKNAEKVAYYTDQLHIWAEKVVLAAEDLGELCNMTGNEKLIYASKRLQEIRDRYNLPFTDEQITDLVRAAYQTLIEGIYVVEEEDD